MERNLDKKGTLLVFPISRQDAHVRSVALVLAKRSGSAADRYWRTTIQGMRGQLQASGVLDEAEINRQLSCFADAVFDRVRAPDRSGSGGEAA